MKGFWTSLGTVLSISLVLFLALFSAPDIHATIQEPYTQGAHRGSSVLFVENTLEAFRDAAQDERYQFIEFDIQYTRDKKIVVFHDGTLLRFQKQLFKVSDLTYEELNSLSRYPVPLYDKVMDATGTSKRLNIEIKSQGDLEEDKQLVDEVVRDVQRRGISKDVLFSSISKDVVKYVKETYPLFSTGIIYLVTPITYFGSDALTERFYESVRETNADYLLLHTINLRHYALLLKHKPEQTKLAFWSFDDGMYVVQEKAGQELWQES